MIYDYQSASDFFTAVKDASKDYRRTKRELDYLQVKAEGFARKQKTRKAKSYSSALPAIIDQKKRLEIRLNSDLNLISKADALIYAQDGGIVLLLGEKYANALWWRFVLAATIKECAQALSYSPRHTRRLIDTALDMVDAYGVENIQQGTGVAMK